MNPPTKESIRDDKFIDSISEPQDPIKKQCRVCMTAVVHRCTKQRRPIWLEDQEESHATKVCPIIDAVKLFADKVLIIIHCSYFPSLFAVHDDPELQAPVPKRAKLICEIQAKQRGYVIEGRVKSKTEVKDFKKGNENEKLFSFIMYDESGEISVLAVNDMCDRWYATGLCHLI